MEIRKHTALFQVTRFAVFALLLCYGVLTGFAPLLHDHEQDLKQHKNCSPCHWTQSSGGVETQHTGFSFSPISYDSFSLSTTPWVNNVILTLTSRSPPLSL